MTAHSPAAPPHPLEIGAQPAYRELAASIEQDLDRYIGNDSLAMLESIAAELTKPQQPDTPCRYITGLTVEMPTPAETTVLGRSGEHTEHGLIAALALATVIRRCSAGEQYLHRAGPEFKRIFASSGMVGDNHHLVVGESDASADARPVQTAARGLIIYAMRSRRVVAALVGRRQASFAGKGMDESIVNNI